MVDIRVEQQIKKAALEVGFDACGITSAEPLIDDGNYLKFWLSENYYGTMQYMANHIEKRSQPKLLYPGAKSCIVVLLNYSPAKLQPQGVPQIAKYAYGNDYHYIIREMLKRLLLQINEQIIPCQGMPFCDSAPLLERALAARAGLGWIGKNGMLINPTLGSYCLIGELLIDVELPVDTAIKERCSNCSRCVMTCPTQALLSPRCLDARRCISYLTIEHRQPIEEDLLSLMDNQLFGCDICQDICPWNSRVKAHMHEALKPNEIIFSNDLQTLTRGSFNRIFQYSPLQRAGLKKLRERFEQIKNREIV